LYHRKYKKIELSTIDSFLFERFDIDSKNLEAPLQYKIRRSIQGFDLYTSLSKLSIYLGHKSLTETEYYLRFTNEYFTRVSDLNKSYFPNFFPSITISDNNE
jgi:hypothetical protein